MSHFTRAAALGCVGALLVVACSDSTTDPTQTEAVSVQFAAEVNGVAFACGQSYANIGTTGSTISPTDFRMYVTNVRLVQANGDEVAVTLDSVAPWQSKGVALVDFENGPPGCANGTAATRTVVTGTVAKGSYTGLKFTLGVPFALNHSDPTTAASPLDLTEMFWSWNGGYKFLRLDVGTTGQPTGWYVHLGSTGCNGASPTDPPTACTNLNMAEISLPVFDVASDLVITDVGEFYASSNVDVNTAAPGCMSGTTDPECDAILPALGVSAVDGSPLPTQALFRSSAP